MIYKQMNPFDFNFELTEFSIENYSIIGRALTIAIKFESEIKAISIFKELKSNPELLTNEKEYKKLIKRIKKFISLHNRIKELNLREDIEKILVKAKESRNYIVHESNLNFENISESEDGRKAIIRDYKEHIKNISEAEKLLLALQCILTNEALPNNEYWQNFSNKIVDWVVSV